MDKGILQRYSVWAKENLEQQVEVSLKTLGINSETEIARAKRTGDVTTIEGDPNSRYVASINNTYELKNLIGPGSASASVTVMIRLRQETGGNVVYKTLMEPRTVTADAILPVRFKAIEGVYGVDTGQVEVVDVENDRVLMSYDVQFFKVQ